jgi:hypothetical protein
VRTEVFAPNRTARRVYQLLGYVERDILLLRPLTRVDGTAAPRASAGSQTLSPDVPGPRRSETADEVVLTLAGGGGAPKLRFRVNPLYCLYHYLVRQGQLPPEQRNPATAAAAARAARVREPRGVHGLWDAWEVPLATAAGVDAAADGLRAAMATAAEELGAALRAAEPHFRAAVWPRRRPVVEAALATLRTAIAPRFPALVRRQADVLGLVWPDQVDAFLVTDGYDRFGAYSHPLTVDVSRVAGDELHETVLHELTHVGDLHTGALGKECLGDRLVRRLVQTGASRRRAWDAWHAVIFAASGRTVRDVLDPDHTDYAARHGLYVHFGVPDLPRLWAGFVGGGLDEPAFFEAVVGQAGAHARPG